MDDDWNNWKKLFDLVGVSEDQMLTKGTLDFLYCFVQKRGGVNNVIRELQVDPLVPTGNYQGTVLKISFNALFKCRHNIVKVAVDRRVDPQTTLTMS